MFYDIFTSFLEIPGIFISIGIILMLIELFRKKGSWLSIFIMCLSIYILSSGWFAKIFVTPLENKYPSLEINSLKNFSEESVIVILGGGIIPMTPRYGEGELSDSALKRVYEGYLIHKNYNLPIIVTGGQLRGTNIPEATIMKQELINFGVNPSYIYAEEKAKNTQQNAMFVLEYLENKNYNNIFLVTSAVHMHRALKYFENVSDDINIIPFPTGYLVSNEQIKWYDFLPEIDSLKANAAALHEYLGLIKFAVTN
ncbi:YdcF family protein [Petrotoga sp. 9PWA.NaAc.5.4]|uniref:YdcF family protein n=1 Tax=Petrotoga sp. 9PWA.NaAc.5.4 TaxID=1434328 RepID=UPI000CBB4363|nr:YdcF family protein [Petrotoga sp. 9PWA.NaAc.5.4]PNR94005.1 hypothetical protein X924_07420 [Petrotoga sp. 9PWA.NaAc.5.4]